VIKAELDFNESYLKTTECSYKNSLKPNCGISLKNIYKFDGKIDFASYMPLI